ncbi:MAG: chromate transporter [Spiroplasma poulsonii]|uniref:Chromate transporter n=1 Tax=Spiroplasma poulsonii TaxID=2138 RepID=A0A2P6FCU7_9MOLU|nr:chromate transporter [Spiroplasma poulsonii]KAF0851656.1 Chromate transporter [Spiroplasma poulsonii]MBW1242345.1 chromate transporter [Spiroplasma poulsonii]PQM31252.1 Chromate transporter [Spiroplasma poulsonii]PWF96257.1 Chromate transporter [Spiroplasma poulsonii]PWF99032.1 Chromate transporter [Spiroplasma poulsonii]
MRKDYYVIKKTKLIAAKEQGWRRKRKNLNKEYQQELHRYYLNANHFFTEQILEVKTIINLNLMTITNLKKSTTKANKSEVKTQIKTLQKNNKVNYQKLNILQPHLFWTIVLMFIKIAFIGFGGGNAMLPIIFSEIVEKKGWISAEYFDKIVILSNALPGPATIQVPAVIGYQLYGWWGALAASLWANFPLMLLVGVLTVILQNAIPELYLAYVSLAIMPVILALIFVLIIKMFRSSMKEITLFVSLPIMIFWIIFLVAVPAPYNIPAIVVIVMLIISLIRLLAIPFFIKILL